MTFPCLSIHISHLLPTGTPSEWVKLCGQVEMGADVQCIIYTTVGGSLVHLSPNANPLLPKHSQALKDDSFSFILHCHTEWSHQNANLTMSTFLLKILLWLFISLKIKTNILNMIFKVLQGQVWAWSLPCPLMIWISVLHPQWPSSSNFNLTYVLNHWSFACKAPSSLNTLFQYFPPFPSPFSHLPN